MSDSALGLLLKELREDRELSLRETAQLADVDHAYVYRLEIGAKEAPSDDVLARIARALKAPKRETRMLHYLAAHTDVEAKLVAYVRTDPTVTYEEFAAVASAAFRGSARPDYAKLIQRVRRILAEEDEDE